MSAVTRLVLYHKQRSSARLRFLRHAHGGVCTLGPLAADATVHPGPCAGDAGGGRLHTHPGMALRAAETELGLQRGGIEADGGFQGQVRGADGCVDVQLGYFVDLDPPIAAAEAAGAAFIDLTEARGLPTPELSLLRLVYEYTLG
ncbi:MAG: hypothetical protein GVY09_19975 [Gammaproteobacteria bacterium]|nr:hypothetical protein [Gammaproteobacteria bacterium]